MFQEAPCTGTVDRRPGSGRPRSARTEENVETVNDLALNQEDKLQTHRTVHEISRKTGRPIHRSSVSQIICKDVHLKRFKRRRAQELTDAICAARMKRELSFFCRSSRSLPLTLLQRAAMLALQALYTSCSNSVRLSVRLSVCHTPVLCQNDGT